MSLTVRTSLIMCVGGTLLSIAALVGKHWITGVLGLLASGALWYNHYRLFMVDED